MGRKKLRFDRRKNQERRNRLQAGVLYAATIPNEFFIRLPITGHLLPKTKRRHQR
jgi:hypothetical protein